MVLFVNAVNQRITNEDLFTVLLALPQVMVVFYFKPGYFTYYTFTQCKKNCVYFKHMFKWLAGPRDLLLQYNICNTVGYVVLKIIIQFIHY